MIGLHMIPCLLLLLFSDWYLFSSFRKNGETGVYFALSNDGKQWDPVNENRPVVQPSRPGMLMRDPWLGRGPDGLWHMLWTVGWTRKEAGGRLVFGHASSTDFVTWSEQREIPVFEDEPQARNVWAPEAVWDEANKHWIIFWSTTIPGRFPDTESTGDNGYNHRIYATTTRDWKTFTPAKLWFDPGFNAIDATVVRDGKRWVMVFKDERKEPLQKNLRLAFASQPSGPWSGVSQPFTGDWVEGPTVARIGSEWWIYYDHYRSPQRVGASKTRDWKTFAEVEGLSFPDDHRHGTVVRIPEETARKLRRSR